MGACKTLRGNLIDWTDANRDPCSGKFRSSAKFREDEKGNPKDLRHVGEKDLPPVATETLEPDLAVRQARLLFNRGLDQAHGVIQQGWPDFG